MADLKKIKLPDNTVLDIKDSRITGVDSSPTSGSGNVITSGGVYTALSSYASTASPALTGTPTAPTAATTTNNTQIATTAFVKSAIVYGRLAYSVADVFAPTTSEIDDLWGKTEDALTNGFTPYLELCSSGTPVERVIYYLADYCPADGEAFYVCSTLGRTIVIDLVSNDYFDVYTYNTVTSISSSSTNYQIPTAKTIYDNYLPLSGGTLTGVLNATYASQANDKTEGINFKNGNSVVAHLGASTLFGIYSSGKIILRPNGAISASAGNGSLEVSSDGTTVYETVTAEGFVKSGGSSSQFLKADGSTDSTTYQSTSSLVTSLSSSSTDAQYPSAKCVYDLIGDIETLLAAL